MFARIKIKLKIKKCRKMIQLLEKKRIRSQAALIEAILTNTVPSDEDVDYFNRYTEEIEKLRECIHELKKELGGSAEKSNNSN